MKTIFAFLGGAILAAGIAVIAFKKQTIQPEAPIPAQQAVATPAPTPLPPSVDTPVSERPGRAPAPSDRARSSAPAKQFSRTHVQSLPPALPEAAPARQSPEQQSPPQPAVAAPPSSAPTASQPPTVSQPAAAPPEPVKPTAPPEPNRVTISAGTILSVRLGETLSTERAQPGQAFSATLDQPLIVDDFVIAERGARVEGRVTESQDAGRVKGVSHLSLELTRITTSDGQRIPVSSQIWTREGEQSRGSDAAKVAAGAGIGAALGAIFGGGKGAAVGAGTGGAAGGGVVLATKGKPVVLPTETRISFRLKNQVTITEKR